MESDGQSFEEVTLLHGREQLVGRIRMRAKDGLASNHHDFARIGVSRSGADDVFKLCAIHAALVLPQDFGPFRGRKNTGKRTRLTQSDGAFIGRGQNSQKLAEWTLQQSLPLEKHRPYPR